ncbi:MAG: glycosyltransferase family 9 protein [Blastocatellia bacterium]
MTRGLQDSLAKGPPIDWPQVRRVLLVRLRSIGDTVLMTPCLQALKEWHPGVEIGVVTEALAAPILEDHPLVGDLLVAGQSAASRLALLAQLHRKRFDLAVNLHGGTTAMMLTALSGARHTVGYRGQRGSWLLNSRVPAPDVILGRKQVHSVEQQLALLRWVGVPSPPKLRLNIAMSAAAEASVHARLISEGVSASALGSVKFAIVAPGAAFDSKRWSSRGFASVIDHLAGRWQLESLVIAGPGQEKVANEVAEAARSVARVFSRISLAELKALVGVFGRVFVGNDCGPMHIAAALGCPIVAVFGSSNPDVWHPWTETAYRVLGGGQDTPDSDVRDAIDRVGVDEVIAAIDQVLESAAYRATS